MYVKVLVLMLSLFATTGLANPQIRQPVVFSTSAQSVPFIVRNASGEKTIVGSVVFTINSANPDDTLTGTLAVTFPAIKAQKNQTAPTSVEMPPPFVERNVKAFFRKGTACPLIRLHTGPLEFSVNGIQIQAEQILIVINESKDEFAQLLCFWTKQINSAGIRRGIVARINRLITGDEPQ